MSRITPAGAGKTGICAVSSSAAWDHPRRCGENLGDRVNAVVTVGSPPQVRGKPTDKALDVFVERITPAGAGKTQGEKT